MHIAHASQCISMTTLVSHSLTQSVSHKNGILIFSFREGLRKCQTWAFGWASSKKMLGPSFPRHRSTCDQGYWLKLAIVCLTGGRWLWLKRRLTIAVLWCCKTLDKGARRQSILLWWGLPGSIWLCMAPPPLLITSWRHLLIWNYWHKGVLWCSVYWLSMQAHSRLPCRTGESRN